MWCSLVRAVSVVSAHVGGDAAALGKLPVADGAVVRLLPTIGTFTAFRATTVLWFKFKITF